MLRHWTVYIGITMEYEVPNYPSITLPGTPNHGTPQRTPHGTPERSSQRMPTRKGQKETPNGTSHPTIMIIDSAPEKTSQETPPTESFETIERKMRFVQLTQLPSNFCVFTKYLRGINLFSANLLDTSYSVILGAFVYYSDVLDFFHSRGLGIQN